MQGAWFICAGSGRSKGKTQTKGQEEKSLAERDRRIRRDVDQALQDAGSYEEFLENLSSMGYELRGESAFLFGNPEQEGQGGLTS